MSIIENKVIYDPVQGDPLESVKISLKELDKQMEKIIQTMLKYEKILRDVQKTGSGAEGKVLLENTEKLANETEKLTALQKAELQIKKQLQAAELKLITSTSDHAKELEALKLQIAENNKLNKQAAKLADEVANSYDKQSALLSKLKKEYKDAVINEKQNTEENKKLLKTIVDLDKKLKDVDEIVGENTRKVGSYAQAIEGSKPKLRKMTEELIQMKLAGLENTEAFKKLQMEAGELKDTIGDARAQINLYASDTRKLDGLIGIFKGIGSAAQIAEGFTALLGEDNKDLAKSIQKMVAIQSILNGVQEIQNALQKESAFMMGVISIKQKIVTAGQWLWNAAMAANPIGLVVAGIAALGAGIAALIVYFNQSEDAIKAENVALDGTVLASKEAVDAHNAHIAAMQELDQQLSVTQGNITDFEKTIIDFAEEYNIAIESINKDTTQKLDKIGGFWNTLKNSILSGGGIFGALVENSIESTKVIIDNEQAKKDAQEKLDKQLKLEQAKKDEKEKSERLKRQADYLKEKERLEKESFANILKNIELQDASAKAYSDRLDKEEEAFKNQQTSLSDALAERMAEDEKMQQDYLDRQEKEKQDAADAELKRQEDLSAKIQEVAQATGTAIGEMLAQGQLSMKEFGKIILTNALEVAKREILILEAKILANQIATKGFLGIGSAAILIASTEAFFTAVKAKVQNFARGTDRVMGGGTETSDSIPANLSKNEGVVPANINKQLLSMGIGATNPKLPQLVANGLNFAKLEKLFEENKMYSSMIAFYLSNGQNNWIDAEGYINQQLWKNGEIRRIKK